MQHTSDYSNDKDDLAEDKCITKFLKLLLRYDYVCRSDCEEALKLNLSEEDKLQFLKQCNEFVQDLDEEQAAKKLVDIRDRYHKQLQKKVYQKKSPWFSLADILFGRATTSAVTETPPFRPCMQSTRSRIVPSSMSDLQSFTQDDSSPLLRRENLTKKHTRCLSSGLLAIEIVLGSQNMQRMSKSEPILKMICPSALVPTATARPIHTDSASVNDNSVITDTDSPITDLISLYKNSSSLATGDSISSTPKANISPSRSSTAPTSRTPISPLARFSIPVSARTSVSPTATSYISSSESSSISPSTRSCILQNSSLLQEFPSTPVRRESVSESLRSSFSETTKSPISPYAKDPIFPSARNPISPLGTSSSTVISISPSAKRCISLAAISSSLTSAKKSLSPAGKKSLSPSGKRSISPSGKRSLSPSGKRSLSPAGKRSLSPAAKKSISPAGKRSLSPAAGKKSLSPVAGKKSLSPVAGNRSLSPAGNRSLSPAAGNRSLSPAAGKRSQLSVCRF